MTKPKSRKSSKSKPSKPSSKQTKSPKTNSINNNDNKNNAPVRLSSNFLLYAWLIAAFSVVITVALVNRHHLYAKCQFFFSGSRYQRINEEQYFVLEEEKAFFKENGYVVLKNVINPVEMIQLEEIFDMFTSENSPSQGKDFCDMSGPFDRNYSDFQLINAMLPRKYYPTLKGNIFEKRAESIAKQLLGDDMVLDYDQLLGKKPQKIGAKFEMHQDQTYWPRNVPETKTATISLAINDAPIERGCLQVVPGSQKEKKLRKHESIAAELVGDDADTRDAHAQRIVMKEDEEIVYCPLNSGDVTVHDEWIVHGSGGNQDSEMRKTYVVAFRSAATVAYERANGFTHSHNDEINWDKFDELGI